MFLFLIYSATSIDDKCVGTLKTPAPISGKTLKYVQVLTRHGARAPLSSFGVPMHFRGYWQCDSDDAIAPRMHAAPINHFRRFKQVLDQRLVEYLPNCRSGDLILSGMDQHVKLGELYHKYIYDEHKLFSDLVPDPETIYARCSDIERTFRSAQAFLHGLFPPQSPNEIIDIVTDSSEFSRLRINFGVCHDLSELYQNWTKSENFTNWTNEKWEKIKTVADFLKLQKSGDNVNAVCDYVATQWCSDKQAPSVVTDEIRTVCVNAIADYAYDLYTTNPWVTGSYTMRELMRIPKMIQNKQSKVKFALFSAHDTTIMAIKTLIEGKNAKVDRIPGYGSHLAMELWEDNSDKELYIRFALNGENLNITECGADKQVVKFSEFLEKYKKMDEYCKER